jgi:LysM repeat protein
VILLLALSPALACGPEFPNNLLDQGDSAVLIAPVSDFYSELEQMKMPPSRFQAVPPVTADREPGAADFAVQAEDAEAADLAAALNRKKLPPDEMNRIRTAHAQLRSKLTKFEKETSDWENSRSWEFGPDGSYRGEATLPKPKYPVFAAPEGLPAEFALYLEGAYAWHNPADEGTPVVRGPWERLLSLPSEDRRSKSTWAAFMLGKSWEEEDEEKAIGYFKQVRELVRGGFKDSIGLAASSLGLEARIYLKQKKYEQAISLYLQQMATGDDTAALSLRFTVAALMKEHPEMLQPLATNPPARQVITAYLISSGSRGLRDRQYGFQYNGMGFPDAGESSVQAWLEAVEAAGINDVESAEKLALAAYQHNQMDLAARWAKRSPRSPVSRWLQAKLLLRQGKVAEATKLLAQVVPSFPIQPPSTNQVQGAELKDRLFMEETGSYPLTITADRQVLGELGVLHLARREYSQALDALLRSGFWMDAAYVAERVLNLDELKAYVDREWPPVSAEQIAEEKQKFNITGPDSEQPTCPAVVREKIRCLLARRLTRFQRGDEAREYYPDALKPSFDQFVENLRTGWDENAATNDRARALWASALISRTNGMELFGTELQPDFAVHAGEYEEGLTWEQRASNADNAKLVPATKDELKRASEKQADPDIRFHYRYQAAFMGWEAAKLMPNNSDETAMVLCTAGGWIKAKDPQTADLFYKALVRRNRRTQLGEEADKIRWFPDLDANGELIHNPKLPAASAETQQQSLQPEPEPVEPSRHYVVHWGESMASIARKLGVPLESLMDANGLPDPNRLQVGQKILLPETNQ